MIKRTVKAIGAAVYCGAEGVARRVGRLVGRSPRPMFTILYYHAVRSEQRRQFERQIAAAARTATIVPAHFEGPFDPGKRYLAVTFDDAFASIGAHAAPVLSRCRVPATVFVPTGCLGRSPGWAMDESCADRGERVMTEDELSLLSNLGCFFGSHTATHARLTACDPDTLGRELSDSLLAVEKWSNGVSELACPYGALDESVARAARQAGYRRVYSIRPENVCRDPEGFVRGRTAVDPGDTMVEFHLKARGAYVWPHALRRILGRRHLA